MPTKTWIGANTGTVTNGWNNGANWSGGVPGGGDEVVFNPTSAFVQVTTTPIASVASISVTTSNTNGVYGTLNPGWNVGTSPVTITVEGGFAIQVGISGSGRIRKNGNGSLVINNAQSNANFSGGWEVNSGTLYFDATAGSKSGTGPFILNGGNLTTSTISMTLPNATTISGNVGLQTGANANVTMTLSGTIALGSVTRTLTIGAAASNTVTLSNRIDGSAGFIKAGPAALVISGASTGPTGLSGAVEVTAGGLIAATSVTANLPNVTSYSVAAGTYMEARTFGVGATSTAATFSGAGLVNPKSNNTSGQPFTFTSDTALAGLTGVGVPGTGGNGVIPSGVVLYAAAGNVYNEIVAKDLPTTLTFYPDINTATTTYHRFTYQSTAATHAYPNAQFYVYAYQAQSIAANVLEFYASQATGALSIGGGIDKVGPNTGAATFVLRGSSAADNTVTGVIKNTAGTLGVTKADAGRWILSGNNSYTGGATVSTGTLSIQHNNGLGATSGAVSVASGATLELQNASPTKSSAALTLNGNGVTVGGVVQGALCSVVGHNTYTASGYTLANPTIRVAADSLTLSGGAVGGASTLTKTGAGKLALTQTSSTYSGITTVSEGTLAANTLAPVNSASSLGQPTTVANGTIKMGAGTTLQHIGTLANSTDRVIELLAAGELAIDGSGTSAGALTLLATGSFTLPAGAKTLRFSGTSAAANTCARAIGNGSSGVTELKKSGSNTWNLTGALTHTGLTTVEGGTLNLDGGVARTLTGGVAISDGTLANGSQTLETTTVTMTGGTVTAKLAFGTSVSVTGGTATLQPNGNANAHTGATTVAAGAKLDLITGDSPATAGAGKAAGDGQVTVNGEIRTSNNSTQRGQMRYKNLSFGNSATLRIGYAGT